MVPCLLSSMRQTWKCYPRDWFYKYYQTALMDAGDTAHGFLYLHSVYGRSAAITVLEGILFLGCLSIGPWSYTKSFLTGYLINHRLWKFCQILVQLGTKMNQLDFEVKRSNVRVTTILVLGGECHSASAVLLLAYMTIFCLGHNETTYGQISTLGDIVSLISVMHWLALISVANLAIISLDLESFWGLSNKICP